MKQLTCDIRRISTENEFWLFGYYDIPAFDNSEKRHLALRVPFMDHMPGKDDVAEIFTIDLETGEKTKIAETTAWCFQQGCFAQWMPAKEDTIIYNVRANTECGYGCVIKNLKTGEEKLFCRPVATVSPDGKYGLSINFDRMFDFRPGYGYAGQKDKWFDDNHPADDGIYLLDLETGEDKLILSLDTLWKTAGGFFEGANEKMLINHINFNTDGTRFVFLLRNNSRRWFTATITADRNGDNVYVLSDFAYASHYYWVNPNVLSIHSSGYEVGDMGNQLYELTDKTHEGRAVDPDFFLADGHVSYSPNREYILYDSYPKPDGHRELYLYDLVTKRGGLLGRFKDWTPPVIDIRCDLHPVWAPSGKQISFDGTFEDFRGMYLVNVEKAMKELREG